MKSKCLLYSFSINSKTRTFFPHPVWPVKIAACGFLYSLSFLFDAGLVRNISTSFWHIFTCPHRLFICVVQPLINLFKRWFAVFQRYFMVDVSFTIIFPWHTFCKLLFNMFFKRLNVASYVLCRTNFFIVFQGSINIRFQVSRGIAVFTT